MSQVQNFLWKKILRRKMTRPKDTLDVESTGNNARVLWSISKVKKKGLTNKRKGSVIAIASSKFKHSDRDFRMLLYPGGKLLYVLCFICNPLSLSLHCLNSPLSAEFEPGL